MRLRLVGLVTLAAASTFVVSTFSACSSSDARPDAGNVSSSSGNTSSSSGSTDTDAGDGADAAACFNTTKDGSETDVDCGGQCARCVVGKFCQKKEDCQDGLDCEVAEVGKPEKKCRIGTCTDTATNGGETDLNCGGATTGCNRCTVGKRCEADTDCRTLKCDMGTKACACPTGMTIIALSGGGAYCIDSTEVTKGEYNKFITANVPTSSQTGPCVGNSDFVPTGAWPPATSPPAPPQGLPYSMGLPVHYVDWCDSVAYCKWAKKELCGKIGGGAVAQNQSSLAGTAAWYDACSAQGTKTWPYGPDYVPAKCNETGGADGGTYGYTVNADDGLWLGTNSDGAGNIVTYANVGCQGGAVGLYQMAGNAAEWENSCSDETTPGAACNVRGGSYRAAEIDADAGADAGTRSRCDNVRQETRSAAFKDVGFRCCLY